MSLIALVITLVVVGVLLWLLNNYVPMDGKIKRIINVVVVNRGRHLATAGIRRLGLATEHPHPMMRG